MYCGQPLYIRLFYNGLELGSANQYQGRELTVTVWSKIMIQIPQNFEILYLQYSLVLHKLVLPKR